MTKYLLAVRMPKQNPIFEFKTKRERQRFIKDVERLGFEWAESEAL